MRLQRHVLPSPTWHLRAIAAGLLPLHVSGELGILSQGCDFAAYAPPLQARLCTVGATCTAADFFEAKPPLAWPQLEAGATHSCVVMELQLGYPAHVSPLIALGPCTLQLHCALHYTPSCPRKLYLKRSVGLAVVGDLDERHVTEPASAVDA